MNGTHTTEDPGPRHMPVHEVISEHDESATEEVNPQVGGLGTWEPEL